MNGMNAAVQKQAGDTARTWPRPCARSARRRARPRAALALAPADAKNAALLAAAARAARPHCRHPRGQRARPRRGRPRPTAPRSFLDRLMLDPKRIEAMAKGLEEIAALPDPVGSRARAVDAAQRPRDRARARAARRHRHHLREPAQRDGRRRRAVPQGRQRGDPARRLGQPSLQPRHPGLPRPRPARGGPARRRRSSSCPPPTARPSA